MRIAISVLGMTLAILLGVCWYVDSLVFTDVPPTSAGPSPAFSPEPRKVSLADRMAQCGVAARQRLEPAFKKASVPYPPERVTLLTLKDRDVLEVYAAAPSARMAFVKSYPVLAASGSLGPKLREGDHQVPEGIYRITFLNPNSHYHLSLRVGYPNEADRAQGAIDRRRHLGGDIMIHGKAVSIGCIAIGDIAIEELFTLVGDIGIANTKCLISPVDLRIHRAPADVVRQLPWTKKLYDDLKIELDELPSPNVSPL